MTLTPQPYVCHVFLKFDTDEFFIIPPERLVSFSFNQYFSPNGGGSFTLTFFDANTFVAEATIMNGTVYDATLQWGYTNGKMSLPRSVWIMTFQIVSIHPFLGQLIQLNGLDLGSKIIMQKQTSEEWPKPDAQAADGFPGRIHNIVKAIADRQDPPLRAVIGNVNTSPYNPDTGSLEVTIETTMNTPLPEPRKDLISAPGLGNVWRQQNMNDMQFISQVLVPHARSLYTNQAGYNLQIRNGNELRFHPQLRRPTRRYIFPDPEGDVISFTPRIQGPLNAKLGAGTIIGTSRDDRTGAIIYTVRKFDKTEQYTIDPHTWGLDNVTDETLRKLGEPSIPNTVSDRLRDILSEFEFTTKKMYELSDNDKLRAWRSVDNYWTHLMTKTFFATLVVVGDVTIEAGDTIQVEFNVGSGFGSEITWKRHFTSGAYMVTEARHDISDQGAYTVTMELNTNPGILDGSIQEWVD